MFRSPLPPPYASQPPSSSNINSVECNVEPDDEWKQNLRRRIRDNIQSLIDEATKSLLAKMEQNPEEKDETLKEYFSRVPPNPRRMAEETYTAELEREREKRRQRFGEGESGTRTPVVPAISNGRSCSQAHPQAPSQLDQAEIQLERDPWNLRVTHSARATASPPSSHHFPQSLSSPDSSLDVEPSEEWKRNLRENIQDNLRLMIESAQDALNVRIKQNPESKDELTYDHVANVVPGLRRAVNHAYVAELKRERKERLWALSLVLDRERQEVVGATSDPHSIGSSSMHGDLNEILVDDSTLPVQGRPLPNLPIPAMMPEPSQSASGLARGGLFSRIVRRV